MLLRFVLCSTICLATLCSLLTIQQINSMSIQGILQDPYVKVFSSTANKCETLKKSYFVLKVGSKSKNQAYNEITYRFKKICNFLKAINMIPDQTSMVASEIQVTYQSKRKTWIFSRVLLLYGTEEDLENSNQYLLKNRCIRIDNKPWIPYFTEKLKILDAYNNAKYQLQTTLDSLDVKIKQLAYFMVNQKKYKTTKQLLEYMIKFNKQQDDSDSQQENNQTQKQIEPCEEDSITQQAICSSWSILRELFEILPKENNVENIQFIFKVQAKGKDEQQYFQEQDNQEFNE